MYINTHVLQDGTTDTFCHALPTLSSYLYVRGYLLEVGSNAIYAGLFERVFLESERN
jgi:hypothetical protein